MVILETNIPEGEMAERCVTLERQTHMCDNACDVVDAGEEGAVEIQRDEGGVGGYRLEDGN